MAEMGLSARTRKRGALLERWRAQCELLLHGLYSNCRIHTRTRLGPTQRILESSPAFLSLSHLGLQPSPKQARLRRPDDRCLPFLIRQRKAHIVPHVQVDVDRHDGKTSGRGELLAMFGLWRRMERREGGAPLAWRQAMEVMRPKTPVGIPISGRVSRLRFGHCDGFIRLWNERDIYFHRADLQDSTTFNTLRIGDLVAFELIEDAVSGARGVRVSRRAGPSAPTT
jgi:hypothetical protein